MLIKERGGSRMNLQQFIEQDDYFYDFKNESPSNAVKEEQNALKKYLNYKIDDTGFTCDRSVLAQALYHRIWEFSREDFEVFDSDTMNSFFRIYRLLILAYDRQQRDLRWQASGVTQDKARYQWLLDEYDYYAAINNHPVVQKFAALTHSLGNFTLVPKGFNLKRTQWLHDYWDLTLIHFRNELGLGDFLAEAQWYYYEDAYLDNGDIKKYWPGHTIEQKALPKHFTCQEIIAVIAKMNEAIEVRGMQMLAHIKQQELALSVAR